MIYILVYSKKALYFPIISLPLVQQIFSGKSFIYHAGESEHIFTPFSWLGSFFSHSSLFLMNLKKKITQQYVDCIILHTFWFLVFFFHHKHTTLIHPMEDIGAMSEILYACVTPLNSESLCNLAVQYHTAPWLKIYTQYAFMAFLQPAISDAW